MAKYYGDIPAVNLGGVIHITISGTECLCGVKWNYGTVDRSGNSNNIIWRELESISCKECKSIRDFIDRKGD
jgi:hypothetical protein